MGSGVTKDRVVQHDIIFVSGMGSGVTEDRVVKHFSQIGEIKVGFQQACHMVYL